MPKRFFGRKVEVEDGNKSAEQTGMSEQDTVEVESAEQERVADEEADSTMELESDELDPGELESEAVSEKDALIAELQARVEQNRDLYLRSAAELENVQKRHAKERSEMLRYAGEQLANDLVEIVDDMERAAAQDVGVGSEELLKGIQLISDRFIATLEKHGIKGEEVVGKPFDPNLHEALATVPTADYDEGTIIEQFKKIYYFKDKLMRAAQVVVAAAPLQDAAQENADADERSMASEGAEEGE